MRRKLWRKTLIPPPLIHKKVFQTRSFLKHNTEWFPGEIFSVLWEKRIFDKMVKLPPSFAWNSSIPEFFRNTERFSDGFYRHCEAKIFQRSWVISASYAWKSAMHEFFWYTEVFPCELFWYCEATNNKLKLWYPLLWIKFFDTPNFLKRRRDAHKFFWHCQTKNFRRKNVIPPFSSIKHFETKNFLKNSRISLRKFSALWDKRISTESRDKHLLIRKFISKTKISVKQKSAFTKFSVLVLWDKKNSNKTVMPRPLLCIKLSIKEFF